MIVDTRGILVIGIFGAIAEILVGIFHRCLQTMHGVETVVPRTLHKHILIPFAGHVCVFVGETAHNASGATAFREIPIGVRREVVTENHSLETSVLNI